MSSIGKEISLISRFGWSRDVACCLTGWGLRTPKGAVEGIEVIGVMIGCCCVRKIGLDGARECCWDWTRCGLGLDPGLGPAPLGLRAC